MSLVQSPAHANHAISRTATADEHPIVHSKGPWAPASQCLVSLWSVLTKSQLRVGWPCALIKGLLSSASPLSLEVHVTSSGQWKMTISPLWSPSAKTILYPQKEVDLTHAVSLLSVPIFAAWKAHVLPRGTAAILHTWRPKAHVQDGKAVRRAQTPDGLVGGRSQPWTASLQSKAIQTYSATVHVIWNKIPKSMEIKNLQYLLYSSLSTCPNWDDKKNSRMKARFAAISTWIILNPSEE